MTATVAPQPELAAPVQYDPLRLLPIAANLLPQEVTEARRGKKLRIAIGGVVAGAVVLTACWYVYARSNTGSAQDGLTNAQQQMTSLQHEQTKYAPLVKAQSASKTIEGQLRQVMASDVQWWQLMPQLRAAAPAGVTLQTVTASMSIGVGASAGSGGPIASVPGVTSKDAVGAVTIVGTAPDKPTIAAYVDALAKVPGVADAYLTGAQAQTGNVYQFNVQLQITSAVLGGKYTPKPTTKAGGH